MGTGRAHMREEGDKPTTGTLTEVATALASRDQPEQSGEMAERYRALLASSGVLGWNALPDGQVRDLSLWCAYTGQAPEQAEGWGWLEALHPDDRERARYVCEKGLATGRHFEYETRVRRHDGTFRTLLSRATPVFAA